MKNIVQQKVKNVKMKKINYILNFQNRIYNIKQCFFTK